MELLHIDFGTILKPQWVKVLVFQLKTTKENWKDINGLYHPNNLDYFRKKLDLVLEKAITENVKLVVFPELAIPEEFIDDIVFWSIDKEIIVIAGSHYKESEGKFISHCPVVYKGNVTFSEKISPSPSELTAGLNPGTHLSVFKNTIVGDFCVLICSDGLTDEAKEKIKQENLDFWIVPSGQNNSSDWHHRHLSVDIEKGNRNSRYIIYSNNLSNITDGKSALFGPSVDSIFKDNVNKGITNAKEKWKIIELLDEQEYYIAELDIFFKRPSGKVFPADEPNIKNIEVGILERIKGDFKRKSVLKNENGNKLPANEKFSVDAKTAPNVDYYAVFNQFVDAKYIKKNTYFDFNNLENSIAVYSNLFGSISRTSMVDGVSLEVPKNGFIDYIVSQIYASPNKYPLLIRGKAGSGKSTLISFLYLFLRNEFFHQKINKIPILINLHHYNKEKYSGKKYLPQAKLLFSNDLKILSDIKNQFPNKEFILLIDGLDDYAIQKVNLNTDLKDIIDALPIAKVVTGLRKNINHLTDRKSKISYLDDPDLYIDIDTIDLNDERYESFIQSFADIESKKEPTRDIEDIKNYLYTIIKQYNLKSIDFLLAITLMDGLTHKVNYENIQTFSSYLQRYLDPIIDIDKAGELAHNIFNKKNISPHEKNCIEWWYIQKHDIFRDFLVASYVAKKLISNRGHKSIGNYVYPFDLNSFCKDLLNDTKENQSRAFNCICKFIETYKAPNSITAKTHLCYLLGRFKDPIIIEEAKKKLIELKAELSDVINAIIEADSDEKLEKDKRKELLLIRTIYISLTYLGDEKASEEYITDLLNSKYFDNLNRGFHLEYYGDIIFERTIENLQHSDEFCDYSKTYYHLYSRLIKSTEENRKYSMFEIELYTLISLAQHRQVHPEYVIDENGKRNKIVLLIEKIVLSKINLTDKIKKYIEFIIPILKVDKPPQIGGFIRSLYNIKREKRIGWVKTNINFPESVGAHMYGAFLLAYFYLPRIKSSEPVYNKELIIKMLLFHDLPEAYDGDIDGSIKTPLENEKEERYLSNISLFGTYDGITNLFHLNRLYNDFHHSNDINSKIARDIDKLDALLQLYIYKSEKNSPMSNEDFKILEKWHLDRIYTDEGKKIKNLILEPF